MHQDLGSQVPQNLIPKTFNKPIVSKMALIHFCHALTEKEVFRKLPVHNTDRTGPSQVPEKECTVNLDELHTFSVTQDTYYRNILNYIC